ncbi:Imm64 family immunity protein [Bacillus infantis]|jgi:hypothetical protein|uniref:Imm64 family immunity protein n=1 Tax=Bacillus infantis TaxID=324767 RepID=UPI002155F2E0|nr:Imm64 family immunity protein [Bacillus infantis]MCR6610579.1 hypothetical protein [Bacillus infantis]
MGATVNLILVKSGLQDLKDNIKSLLDALIIDKVRINEVKYAKDKNGFHWLEFDLKKYTQQDLIHKCLRDVEDFFYFQISISHFKFRDQEVNALIKIDRYQDNYYSINLEFNEDEILKSYEVSELLKVEEKIKSTIIHDLREVTFDYAFANQEGEVEYSPEQFYTLDKYPYSLVYTVSPNGVIVEHKSDWYINGLDSRI